MSKCRQYQQTRRSLSAQFVHHRHRRQCRLHMPRFQQNRFKSCSLQPRMQPLRQRPRLKSNPPHCKAQRLKKSNQSFRLARDFRPPSKSSPVHPQCTRSTVPKTRQFRHTDPWLSSVSRCLGPTQRRDPVSSSIGGQPPSSPLARSRAHYRI